MRMKIVPKHLNKIKEYQNLDYLAFQEKLVEVFEEPDMASADLNALAAVTQDRVETISEYMHLVQLLVLKAHSNLEHFNASLLRVLCLDFMINSSQHHLRSLRCRHRQKQNDYRLRARLCDAIRSQGSHQKTTFYH